MKDQHQVTITVCDECRKELAQLNNLEAISVILCDECNRHWKINLYIMKLTRSQATTILNTMLEYLATYDDPKTFPPHEYHDLYILIQHYFAL